ncbi:MAG: diguanylate cyclase, partial [Nitrospinales bacterium]
MLNEKFFSQIVHLAADSIIAVDDNLKVVYFNREAEKVFGYCFDEIVGQHLNVLIPSRYHDQHDQYVRQFNESGVTARLMGERTAEVQALRRDGREFFAEISIVKAGKFLAAIIRDVTEKKEIEKQLKIFAEYDSLTGIMNRRKIEEVAQIEIERASRFSRTLSLLLLDIDHFKRINDAYGHDVGDLAIKHLVSVSTKNMRKVDSMGRWGGEEFIILLPEVGKEGISVFAEKIRRAVEQQPLRLDDHKKIFSTISIGGTIYNKPVQ